jgi:hypothetical protein
MREGRHPGMAAGAPRGAAAGRGGDCERRGAGLGALERRAVAGGGGAGGGAGSHPAAAAAAAARVAAAGGKLVGHHILLLGKQAQHVHSK